MKPFFIFLLRPLLARVVLALALFFVIGAIALLTGCEVAEHDHPLLDHDHPVAEHEHAAVTHEHETAAPKPYVIMRVRSPYLQQIDPAKVKINDMEAFNNFFKGVPPVAVLLAYPEAPVNGQHLIKLEFTDPPRNFRITKRPDTLMAHWFVTPTELRLRVFCGLEDFDGNNGKTMVLEWDSGSETLRTWCGDP